MTITNTVDQATLDANTAQIDLLTEIIRANRLHESYCSAFSTAKGDFAGMFSSMAEKSCHCWVDSSNRADAGMGFATYQYKTETLDKTAYTNRHYAYTSLMQAHPELSPDSKDDNYWAKSYYIVEVTTTPLPESEPAL